MRECIFKASTQENASQLHCNSRQNYFDCRMSVNNFAFYHALPTNLWHQPARKVLLQVGSEVYVVHQNARACFQAPRMLCSNEVVMRAVHC